MAQQAALAAAGVKAQDAGAARGAAEEALRELRLVRCSACKAYQVRG